MTIYNPGGNYVDPNPQPQLQFEVRRPNVSPASLKANPYEFDVYYNWTYNWTDLNSHVDVGSAIPWSDSAVIVLNLNFEDITITGISGGISSELQFYNNTSGNGVGFTIYSGNSPLPTTGQYSWGYLCRVQYELKAEKANNINLVMANTSNGYFRIDSENTDYVDANGNPDNSIDIYADPSEFEIVRSQSLTGETNPVHINDQWPGNGLKLTGTRAYNIPADTEFTSIILEVKNTTQGNTIAYQEVAVIAGQDSTVSFDDVDCLYNGYHTVHLKGTYGSYGAVVQTELIDQFTIVDRGDSSSDQPPVNESVTGSISGDELIQITHDDAAMPYTEPGLNLSDPEGDPTGWEYASLDFGADNTRVATGHSEVGMYLADLHNQSPGMYLITYIAASLEGSKIPLSLTRRVEVVDRYAPVITLENDPTTIPLNTVWDEATHGGYTAMDDADGDLTSAVQANNGVNSSTPGEYSIAYWVDDSSGNRGYAYRDVRVLEQPTVTSPAEINANGQYEAGEMFLSPWDVSGVVVTKDDFAGSLTYERLGDLPDGALQAGTWTVIYKVTDSYGQTAQSTSTFTIASASEDLSISATAMWGTVGGNAGDFRFTITLGADIDHGHIKITAEETGDVYELHPAGVGGGTRVVSIDSSELNIDYGNFAWEVWGADSSHTALTSTITGVLNKAQPDTTPPVITLLVENSPPPGGDATVTLTQGTMFEESIHGGYTATDDVDPSVTVLVGGDYVHYDTPGTYTIEYSATDQAGNTTVVTRDVIIEPEATNDSPVINITGNHTYETPLMWERGDTWSDPGVSASDTEDGTVSVSTDLTGLNVNLAGTYYVNYSATDSDQNTTTAQRVVVVCDNAAPVITLNGSATPTLTQSNDPYVDAHAVAMDGGGDISDRLVVTGADAVDLITVGTYTVEFNVSDASGNAAPTVTRTVTVEAAEPSISLVGDMMVHVEVYGGTWSDPGATATDHDGTDITSSITTDDPVQQGVAGEYTVTYSVTNSFGNTASVTRMVHVSVHMCPVVEDVAVPSGAPNMAGLALVAGNMLNYNGLQEDVSGYTTGQWASLALNVGLSETHVTASTLSVLNTTGRTLSDSTYWFSLMLPELQTPILEWVANSTFATGVSTNMDGSDANVTETVIKFLAYQSGRNEESAATIKLFSRLADEDLVYPFDWHCAVDSSFSAQDVAIMASDKDGIEDLKEDTSFPDVFIEYRLREMLVRGAIDYYDFYKKWFGKDRSGHTGPNGERLYGKEFTEKSPRSAQRVLDSGNGADTQSKSQPAEPGPNVVASTPTTVVEDALDRVHNFVSTADSTKRSRRQPPALPTMSTTVSVVASLGERGILSGLSYFSNADHLTVDFLGNLYQAESSKPQPSSNVLTKVAQMATDAGLDISAFQGSQDSGQD